MRWTRPGSEGAVEALFASLAACTWPEAPPGFTPVGLERPMRRVFRGVLDGPEGTLGVALKWSRPVTRTDRVSRRVRGGKGIREATMLHRLETANVPAVLALGATDESVDALVTAWIDDLTPIEDADRLDRADLLALAALVRGMQGAGVDHRDLHVANVGRTGDGFCLIDLGRARAAAEPAADDVAMLARLAHGLGHVRRTQRRRALDAWCEATGIATSPRELARRVERRLQARRRRFLQGRDRRATRDGFEFTTFSTTDIRRGIRARDATSDAWIDAAGAWLAASGGTPLKADGRVVRRDAPDGTPVAVKRFDRIAPGRLPRPLRGFRAAEALRNRGVPCPRPLLAAARDDGSGILVSAYVAAPDAHAFFHDGYAALPHGHRVELLAHLGRTIRRMHDAGMGHRDLKAPNLLVDADTPAVWICDVDGASRRQGPLRWRRRLRDLARLDASLPASRTDRLHVFDAYLRVPPWTRLERRRLLERLAREVARKRGPSGLPR